MISNTLRLVDTVVRVVATAQGREDTRKGETMITIEAQAEEVTMTEVSVRHAISSC